MSGRRQPARKVIPLLDFVSAASPRFTRPNHLAPVAELLERSTREPVRAVISVPPRHGKTELVKHFVAWRLLQDPTLRFTYASYAGRFADKRSREMRSLFRRVGGAVSADAKARADWRTAAEDEVGGLWSTSVE